jgi:hypothetical protein
MDLGHASIPLEDGVIDVYGFDRAQEVTNEWSPKHLPGSVVFGEALESLYALTAEGEVVRADITCLPIQLEVDSDWETIRYSKIEPQSIKRRRWVWVIEKVGDEFSSWWKEKEDAFRETAG